MNKRTWLVVLMGSSLALATALVLLGQTPQTSDAERPAQPQTVTDNREPDAGDRMPSTETQPPGQPKPEPADKHRDRAIASLSESVTEGDPRTPQLARPAQRPRPDDAILADQALYRAHQRAQEVENVMPFLTGVLEIEQLEQTIYHARITASRSAEEIREAEEALDALYEARERLMREHPEVYAQLTGGAPTDKDSETDPVP